ncbi:putative RNA-binding protein [Colletotrichum trifolii]|uniref:Putative RNA-binding protein n=1 Tax=Colletotrichum trifolii TaxID=5466 RepID=A0A4R8R703_COLTR|nr:putative RNA-binding protein [Colletotrichum trifolii]
MFFPQSDAPLLKAWLMKKLPEVSDTETDILADYVLALLASQEGDAEPIRAACESELPQFLNTDTAPAFVDELFRVIEYKSYLPGAPPPPPKRLEPTGVSRFDGSVPSLEPSSQGGSRKRSYYERGDASVPDDRTYGFIEERAYKQPRRGQGVRPPSPRGNGEPFGYSGQPQTLDAFQPSLPGSAPYDPNYPQPPTGPHDWRAPPAYPQGPQYGQPLGPRRNQQKCRDFMTIGYCARGSSCPYDHGTEPLRLPPTEPNGAPNFEGFDARDAAMMMSQNFRAMQQLMEAFNAERGGRGGKRGRQMAKGRRRPRRASFSADGPVHDQTKTKIVVESIPEDHFSEDAVRKFFSQFGAIEEVTLNPQRRLAIVQYDTWDSAQAAYSSPKVIFDNRFVKVFWHLEEHERPDGNTVEGQGEPVEPEIDMDDFIKKQEEAQRLHEEKMQKKAELDKQRQELEQRQQDLLSRHREVQQKLQAKLAAKGGDTETSEPGSNNSALRAQLAALEDEAKLLGLDPSADEPTPWGSFRGGYRGDVHAAYAAYSLDNRPRTVSVSGVDLTPSDKDEALRQYLFGVGEFTEIKATPTNTQVTFKDRKSAEKFYHGMANNEIAGINGPVELSWVANAAPAKTSTDNGTSKRKDLDQDVAIGNAAPNGSSAMTVDQQQEQQQEVDYDVADDDWGVDIQTADEPKNVQTKLRVVDETADDQQQPGAAGESPAENPTSDSDGGEKGTVFTDSQESVDELLDAAVSLQTPDLAGRLSASHSSLQISCEMRFGLQFLDQLLAQTDGKIDNASHSDDGGSGGDGDDDDDDDDGNDSGHQSDNSHDDDDFSYVAQNALQRYFGIWNGSASKAQTRRSNLALSAILDVLKSKGKGMSRRCNRQQEDLGYNNTGLSTDVFVKEFEEECYRSNNAEYSYIWVDALCINQDDLQEKSDQIPLMDRVYSQARATMMWLGGGELIINQGFPKTIMGLQIVLDRLQEDLRSENEEVLMDRCRSSDICSRAAFENLGLEPINPVHLIGFYLVLGRS